MDELQNQGSRDGASAARARLIGAFAALAAGAAAVVFGVTLVRGLPAIASTASTSLASSGADVTPAGATSSTTTGFPAPPRGAFVLGASSGAKALGLSVLPGNGKIGLQTAVIGGLGNPAKGLPVRFEVTGASGQKVIARATTCGPGCYRATAPIARPASVDLRLGQDKPVRFTMPAVWPPRPAGNIVNAAGIAWRSLRALAFKETLTDGRVTLKSDWKVIAPDRVQYHQQDGRGDAVIIGDRRWDKGVGQARWLAASQTPVRQPVPFWQSATNARILGTVMSRGRPAWKVSFYDPGTPGWFTVIVDKKTLHTNELWMTAAVHFMHEVYGSFNGPVKIVPPA